MTYEFQSLQPYQLALAGLLLALNAGLSIWLKLGLEKKLIVATLRATVQLTLLGFLLVPVFSLGSPILIVGMCLVMVILAAREAVGRTSRRYRGMTGSALLAMFVGGGLTAVLATSVIIGVDPWWEPHYLVPLVGMILGNALTGVSLGLERCLQQLDEGRRQVELLLAFGATRWEAGRPIAAEAIRTGMIPILNAMSAVGLVTIPGMMTGQILGGTPPIQAARYQLLILFLIAGATAAGVCISVLITLRVMFDSEHRLRLDRLVLVKGN